MVFITEELVRKRAEHNNYEISTLEELSLHQQDLEAIDNLDKWCKDLKILYLQSNLISKIENVTKLKKLEYLNLALNNITKIDNLDGCESLKKLDLTVNFVSELTTVESLRKNEFFSELYLTGNPCTQFENYREYVIATLPQLKQLDGKEIEKSERILAMQQYSAIRDSILQQQQMLRKSQQKDLKEAINKNTDNDGRWYTDIDGDILQHEKKTDKDLTEISDDDEREKSFWSEPTEYTPESRIEMHNHIKEVKTQQQKQQSSQNEPIRHVKFFKDNGEPLNVNTAKIQFRLEDEEDAGIYVLDVHCYKHLDTSLIDVDVQPNFVRVNIKGKILQLVLNEEVNPDKSTAQRSETTGHLLVKIPKASELINGINKKSKFNSSTKKSCNERGILPSSNDNKETESPLKKSDISLSDLTDIVKNSSLESDKREKQQKNCSNKSDFLDDPDVPPLI